MKLGAEQTVANVHIISSFSPWLTDPKTPNKLKELCHQMHGVTLIIMDEILNLPKSNQLYLQLTNSVPRKLETFRTAQLQATHLTQVEQKEMHMHIFLCQESFIRKRGAACAC